MIKFPIICAFVSCRKRWANHLFTWGKLKNVLRWEHCIVGSSAEAQPFFPKHVVLQKANIKPLSSSCFKKAFTLRNTLKLYQQVLSSVELCTFLTIDKLILPNSTPQLMGWLPAKLLLVSRLKCWFCSRGGKHHIMHSCKRLLLNVLHERGEGREGSSSRIINLKGFIFHSCAYRDFFFKVEFKQLGRL